jgi:hypothetical protein
MYFRWTELSEAMTAIRKVYTENPNIKVKDAVQPIREITGFPVTEQEVMHIIYLMDPGPPLPKIRKKQKRPKE